MIICSKDRSFILGVVLTIAGSIGFCVAVSETVKTANAERKAASELMIRPGQTVGPFGKEYFVKETESHKDGCRILVGYRVKGKKDDVVELASRPGLSRKVCSEEAAP